MKESFCRKLIPRRAMIRWEAGGAAKVPSMVFMHGAGGINNEANIRGQSLGRMLADPAFAAEMPMLVIIPVSQQRGTIAGSCRIIA